MGLDRKRSGEMGKEGVQLGRSEICGSEDGREVAFLCGGLQLW